MLYFSYIAFHIKYILFYIRRFLADYGYICAHVSLRVDYGIDAQRQAVNAARLVEESRPQSSSNDAYRGDQYGLCMFQAA